MAETRFIKTVAFGGYDRAEVIRKLEFLNTQVYELKNELRETKLIMEAYKKGTEQEKVHESVLAGERTKLTSVQVQNETLTTKLRATEDENKKLGKDLEDANAEMAKLKKELEDANSKLTALQSGSDAAALSAVFIEAQKSANSLVENAQTQAAELEEKSKQTAIEIVEEADDAAAKIIYEAEKNAAITNADALNKAEEMKVASNNLRAVMLEDVKQLSKEITAIKTALEDFQENGTKKIAESEKMLEQTQSKLTEGGVPTYKVPQSYEAEIPEPPETKKSAKKAESKSSSKLDELAKMANSIDSKGQKGASGSLADLNKQAQAIESGKKAGYGMNLDQLAKQAADTLGENSSKKNSANKKSGSVDLAELAKQAASLGGGKK